MREEDGSDHQFPKSIHAIPAGKRGRAGEGKPRNGGNNSGAEILIRRNRSASASASASSSSLLKISLFRFPLFLSRQASDLAPSPAPVWHRGHVGMGKKKKEPRAPRDDDGEEMRGGDRAESSAAEMSLYEVSSGKLPSLSGASLRVRSFGFALGLWFWVG